MGRLGLAAVLAAFLAACATPPPPVEAPAVPETISVPGPSESFEPAGPTEPPPPRWVAGLLPAPVPAGIPWESPSPLDLDRWPFGWVEEPRTTFRLGLPPRFWSNQKARWREVLDPKTPGALRVLRLRQIEGGPASAEETLRSTWLLAEATAQAGLRDDARFWLDRAWEQTRDPSVALERAWDQAFRLSDLAGARALWPGLDSGWSAEETRKALLLRAKLFAGTRAVPGSGFISVQLLDRDDLWAATWNGAVVRWALPTDQVDVLLPEGPSVAPITRLVATAWFLYAFQDQALLRYSKVTGTWRTFPYPAGWTGLRVEGVVAEGEERLWVASLGQGLWRWDGGEWSLVDDGGGGPFLTALSPRPEGGFWVGTKDRGLWSWDSGRWSAVEGPTPLPVNISVLEPDPKGGRWLVGTWGEGAWTLADGRLQPWSPGADYVSSAAWTEDGPLWTALDRGVVRNEGREEVWGPRDGVSPDASALVVWEGRWIWASGQGWGWWTEYENPALLR